MCLTLSQADEEKSTRIENPTMDHQSDDMVRPFFFYLLTTEEGS